MKSKEVIAYVTHWLSDYLEESRDYGFVVGVSGGIDSVVMLRYLAEAEPTRTEAFTFAFEGQPNSELPEATIAAATSRVLSRSSAGSCQTVMACISTTQKIHS